jgi:hypothetical protein
MSQRKRTKGKARKQISLSPDIVPVGLDLARRDCRSFSNYLEFLILRDRDARRIKEVA